MRHFPFEGFDPFKEFHVIIYKRSPIEAFGKIVDACSFNSIEKATEFYEKENHGLSSDMAMRLTYCKIYEEE